MTLEIIEYDFSVCKLPDASGLDLTAPFCFTAATDHELSLVCRTQDVPAHALDREDGWRAFRVAGTLDFSLVGVLAELSRLLAEACIGLFAVSTYDTDYILTRKENFDRALAVLSAHGHTVVPR